jgi:hypothetical protein
MMYHHFGSTCIMLDEQLLGSSLSAPVDVVSRKVPYSFNSPSALSFMHVNQSHLVDRAYYDSQLYASLECLSHLKHLDFKHYCLLFEMKVTLPLIILLALNVSQ